MLKHHPLLRAFLPHKTNTSTTEKVISGIAGGIAILLLSLAIHSLPQMEFKILLLGSMAASATLLFALPHSPLSQPWNLVGSHLISALLGWLSILFIPDHDIAAGVAVGSSIMVTYLLNCLHPPGGATALLVVLGSEHFSQSGWAATMLIVFANCGISLLLALSINNLLPGRKYPSLPAVPPAVPKPAPFIELTEEDLQKALAQIDSAIDVSTEDLALVYRNALQHAQERIERA